jgi:alpha-beta hydrolase superfamily lysophospholipase
MDAGTTVCTPTSIVVPAGCPEAGFSPIMVVQRGEMTVAQKGTIMKSAMVLSWANSVRTHGVDMDWQARDERLVTVAEAESLRAGGATSRLIDERFRGKR